MSSLSRRNFLYAGGAVAAGAAALATPGGHAAAAARPPSAAAARPSAAGVAVPELAEVFEPEGDDQMVMYVSNTGAGEITVLTDGHEVVFHDPQLVARVQRAAKKASA